MIKSLITEHGLPWAVNRTLYSLKLKTLKLFPSTEKIYEKPVNIKRIEIFDFNAKPLEVFLRNLPNEKQEGIVRTADKAIKGKIKGFSSIELDYGNPIDWHYNPLTKVRVDKDLKWFQIPDFDPDRGDIKVIWEASRFAHFYSFVRAFLITKNKKYYNAFSEQLDSWVRDNKYSFGSNYKCGQEATIRMINAIITYSAFKECNLITEKDKENLSKLIEGSYKKVLSNFFYAHKCIKNNHTLSEITGLIIGAWCSEDQNRLERAYELLNKEIDQQFTPDGGYIQNSFNYQRLALQLMEFNLKISEKTGGHINDQNKEKIINSVHQLYQLQDINGDVPNKGANDGALLFPVSSCDYRDFRPIINSLSCIINNERIYQSGLYDEEALWFFNRDANDLPIKEVEKKSKSYKDAGLFSLRKDRETFMMIVLKDNKTRPGQMDQLHVDLWHKGKNILCDSGSYSYADPIGKEMSLTAAHNTAKLKNIEQMNKRGAFFVTDWSRAKDLKLSKNSFTGTMVSKNGYKHTRHIKSVDKGYVIKDEVTGNGEYCEFNFHTPYDINVGHNEIDIYNNDKLICRIIVDVDGEITVKKSYRSIYYLRKEEINCLSIKKDLIDKKCTNTVKVELYD